jgi:hypothetical protein
MRGKATTAGTEGSFATFLIGFGNSQYKKSPCPLFRCACPRGGVAC